MKLKKGRLTMTDNDGVEWEIMLRPGDVLIETKRNYDDVCVERYLSPVSLIKTSQTYDVSVIGMREFKMIRKS